MGLKSGYKRWPRGRTRFIPKLGRRIDCYEISVISLYIPVQGTTQMALDISLLESVESRYLAHISRSTGKDQLSGHCHHLLSDVVLCLWTLTPS